MSDSFTGIYKGMVVDNDDPQFGYRVVCVIPQVLGDAHSNWAEPLQPTLYTPRINDVVWVQFADGDPSQPLYQSRVVVDPESIPEFSLPGDLLIPGTITADQIAANAVTGDKIEATAIDGKTITGPTIQTASSGNRLKIHDDSAGGIIEFYNGTSGESPGFINPVVTSPGGQPEIVFRSPTDPANPTTAGFVLASNSSGQHGQAFVDCDLFVSQDSILVGDVNVGSAITLGSGSSGRIVCGQIECDNFPTTTGTANLRAPSQGSLINLITSLSKYKIDQEPLSVEAVRGILDVTPKTWFDRAEVEENGGSTEGLRRIPGVVAEDVEEHAPAFATYDADGELQGVAYDRLAAGLIPIIKDQQRRIKELEDRLASLEAA